jgi:hypothetical protein
VAKSGLAPNVKVLGCQLEAIDFGFDLDDERER